METLISDLKKVMNSDIENKDKYIKMLINGFLRERDSELLTIQGVVKSLKTKETMPFDVWFDRNVTETKDGKYYVDGERLRFYELVSKHKTECSLDL